MEAKAAASANSRQLAKYVCVCVICSVWEVGSCSLLSVLVAACGPWRRLALFARVRVYFIRLRASISRDLGSLRFANSLRLQGSLRFAHPLELAGLALLRPLASLAGLASLRFSHSLRSQSSLHFLAQFNETHMIAKF
jgi:hypothetical protein